MLLVNGQPCINWTSGEATLTVKRSVFLRRSLVCVHRFPILTWVTLSLMKRVRFRLICTIIVRPFACSTFSVFWRSASYAVYKIPFPLPPWFLRSVAGHFRFRLPRDISGMTHPLPSHTYTHSRRLKCHCTLWDFSLEQTHINNDLFESSSPGVSIRTHARIWAQCSNHDAFRQIYNLAFT